MTSAAYRQASRGSDEGVEIDPDNKLLSHYPRQRLDGEALRDAMLAVSGQLNLKAGGPSVFPELPAEVKSGAWKPSADPQERNRRSVYVFVKRNLRYPLFALFDAPGSDFELLITDVMIPQGSGHELARTLVERRPTLRVLFVSGYSSGGPIAGLDPAQVRFLTKPFGSAELTDMIQDLIPRER